MTELIVGFAQDIHNHGIGVFGTNDVTNRTIFWGTMPETVTEGILLLDSVSPSGENYIDTENLVIDVWVKSSSSYRAKELARKIFDTYNRRYHWDVDDWHIYWSKVLGGISDSGRTQENSKLFKLSIQFMCRNLLNIS